MIETEVETLRRHLRDFKQFEFEERMLREKYEYALSQIANIDTSFLNQEGDMTGYSPEEELRRIHSIVSPIWEDIVDRNKAK